MARGFTSPPRSKGRWLGSSVALWVFMASRLVAAQTASSVGSGVPPDLGTSSEADRLFLEGRRLIETGQPARACEVLARSQELEGAVGTLLNLGLCHRQCNRLASAWRSYLEAERQASDDGDAQRAELGRMEAAEIERLLGRVVIEVGHEPEPGLVLHLDGKLLGRDQWGRGVPLDAGPHLLRAEAPGHRPWQVELGSNNGSSLALRVPPLEPESRGQAKFPVESGRRQGPVAPSATAGTLSSARQASPAEESSLTGREALVLGLGGVGLVALGAGSYFALAAMDKKSDSSAECRSNVCTLRGVALRDEARDHASVATVLGAVGVGALVGAGVLWLSAPAEPEAARSGAWHGVSLDLRTTRVGVGIGGEFQ